MKKNNLALLGLTSVVLLTGMTACNNASKDGEVKQTNGTVPDNAMTTSQNAADDSLFIKDGSGLERKEIFHGTGTQSPALESVALIHLVVKIGDSIVVNTDKQNNDQPVPQIIAKPQMEGDLMNGLMKMKVGDSFAFRMLADTFFTRAHQPKMPWIKPGAYIEYYVKLDEISSKDAIQAKMEEQRMKGSKLQNEADDKILQAYFKSHNIKNLQKTSTGIYYTVNKQGSGPHPKRGQQAVVNYTGQNLQGVKFDSNVDPAFNHVAPFDFSIGGNVIAGWSQAVPLMNKGMKATFYIPSSLAYGPNGSGDKIKPNEILIFDIELISFK